jgi:hypothetical protein
MAKPIFAGILSALFAFYCSLWLFRGFEPAWAAHVLALCAGTLPGALIAVSATGKPRLQLFGLAMGSAFPALIVASAAFSSVVVWRAEARAGDAAHCIQVANSEADYHTARTWLDFSPLTLWAMRASGMSMQYHAVLVVGTDASGVLYNWSYRARDWVAYKPKLLGQPVIQCRTNAHFVNNLPIAFARNVDSSTQFLRMGLRAFTIPKSYGPRTSMSEILTIYATTPTFGPFGESCSGRSTDCINHSVEIYLYPRSRMSWLSESTDRTRVRAEREGRYGRVRTNIQCWPPSYNGGRSCIQVFLVDGILFYFHMPEDEVSQWPGMQDNLIALYRSFLRS